MDARVWIRLGAVMVAAAVIAATAFEVTRKEKGTTSPVGWSEEPPSDPLRAAQRRCQLLGEAAARDAECLRVWAETRDRFLGTAPAPTSPQLHYGR